MRIDSNLAEIIDWIDSLEKRGKEAALIEFRGSNLFYLSKDNSFAVIVKLGGEVEEEISFYSDDFPSTACEVRKERDKIVFEWKERGATRRIEGRVPERSNPELDERFFEILAESEEWATAELDPSIFSSLVDLKVTNLSLKNGELELLQIDPRGKRIVTRVRVSGDGEGRTIVYTEALQALRRFRRVTMEFGLDTPILVFSRWGIYNLYIIISNLIPPEK